MFKVSSAQHRLQRTAAMPLAKAGAICKGSNGLAVVVVQSPPLPLSLTLGGAASGAHRQAILANTRGYEASHIHVSVFSSSSSHEAVAWHPGCGVAPSRKRSSPRGTA